MPRPILSVERIQAAQRSWFFAVARHPAGGWLLSRGSARASEELARRELAGLARRAAALMVE